MGQFEVLEVGVGGEDRKHLGSRVGKGDRSQLSSERVVRDVVRDSNKSHDEMLCPKRWRHCNLGKWSRGKKL